MRFGPFKRFGPLQILFTTTGQNTDSNTLFTYDGTVSNNNWDSHLDLSYKPVFFDPNLTIMFEDETKRSKAISACNNGASEDTDPAARRECYFDFKVTEDAALAAATSETKSALDETKSTLGLYNIYFTWSNIYKCR